jgi:hypothetical protein
MKILLALFLSLSTIAAHASVVTYSFGGAFNAPIRSAIPGQSSAEPIFWGLAAQGDRFSGSFTFDTSAATPDPEFAGVSSAPLLGFALQASERFNSALTSWQLGSIGIADDPDYSELVVSMLMRLDDAHFMTAILRMTPSSNDAFAGGVVPDGFNDFSGANLFLTIFHERELVRDEAYGSALVGLGNEVPAPAPVPEPATAALLLAGLAGLVARRRRA